MVKCQVSKTYCGTSDCRCPYLDPFTQRASRTSLLSRHPYPEYFPWTYWRETPSGCQFINICRYGAWRALDAKPQSLVHFSCLARQVFSEEQPSEASCRISQKKGNKKNHQGSSCLLLISERSSPVNLNTLSGRLLADSALQRLVGLLGFLNTSFIWTRLMIWLV